MLTAIADKIDAFARWFDRRFILCGDELPSDVRQFCVSLFRIFAYIPAIWNNYDWEGRGVFPLLKIKLERLEQTLSHGLYVDVDKRRIRICIQLLENIIGEKYENEFYQQHNEKWGEVVWNFVGTRIVLTRKNVVTMADENLSAKEMLMGIRKAQEQRQKAINLCMKMIARYADEWWD